MLFDNYKDSAKEKNNINLNIGGWHTAPTTALFFLLVTTALISGAAGGVLVNLFNNHNWLGGIVNNENEKKVVSETKFLPVQEESATTDVVKNVSPSVVSIIISKDVSKIYNFNNQFPFDSFFNLGIPFNFIFGQSNQQQSNTQTPQGKQEIGGGTGFVVNQAKGLILTNKHVVDDTEAEYTVLTNDGRKLPAKVVARDQVNDMALVQVDDKTLPAVSMGDSTNVQIGQTVIAIGNALGEYRNTVTKGVISGIGRNVTAGDNQGSSEQLEGVLQTDAAINPGNSGGPLLNLSGQVIGMNTAVNKEGQLIGFAIPVNEAKRMIQSYEQYGRIVRPYLGIRYIMVTPELAKANKLEYDYGALVVGGRDQNELAVVPGGPADKAGIVENDIILELDGQKITSDTSLLKMLSKYNPDDVVVAKIYHKGDIKEAKIKLEDYKETK